MPNIQRIQVETNLCRGCEACVLACSLVHEGQSNPALSRIVVTKNMQRYTFNIVVCEQCDDPKCVEACPSRAMLIDERGVVMIVDDDCLRCGGCEASCPSHAIFHNQQADRFFKCDLCLDRAEGPACVEFCPVGALTLRLELRPKEDGYARRVEG